MVEYDGILFNLTEWWLLMEFDWMVESDSIFDWMVVPGGIKTNCGYFTH